MNKSFKVLLQYLLPHHLISRLTYLLMHSRVFPFRDALVTHMIRKYNVQVDEAADPDYTNRKKYPYINSFFVRALKPGARPIAEGEDQVCSPADGTISQMGKIESGRIFQAKGHWFSLTELLGGSEQLAEQFADGHYATIYLSPSDYHRVHIPFGGTLKKMIHVPGRLFSVAPVFIDQVPGLFARNERVVSIFETEIGPMAVILVGAINVGSIETVWAGKITPPGLKRLREFDYDGDEVTLEKGDELGRFNMGSTVIVLFARDKVHWLQNLASNDKLKMGQAIANLKRISADPDS